MRLAKGDSTFCYPEHIEREMKRLFDWLKRRRFLHGLAREDFALHAAHLLAELNAIHPFREGNGRTQNVFLLLLAEGTGFRLDLGPFTRERVLDAMIASMQGNESLLADLILDMCQVRSALHRPGEAAGH